MSTDQRAVGLGSDAFRGRAILHQGAFEYNLEPGMMLCVEAYIGAKGGREGVKLEDQVLITDDDVAVMLMKPCRDTGLIAASEPPATIASAYPAAIQRAALPMDWVPAAQAVTVVSQGPWKP